MRPLSQCRRRRALFSAIALSLVTLSAQAATLTGPGNTHTINPGDTVEDWTVSDGAELTIAAGGGTNTLQVDNASVIANGGVLRGLFGIRLSNAATATLTAGEITIASAFGDAGSARSGSQLNIDGTRIDSAGRGLAASGAGSLLSIRNSTVTTDGEAFQLGDGAQLVLDTVTASASGTGASGLGYALDISGGSAQVSNSSLSGNTGAVSMTGGELTLVDSQLQSTSVALLLAGTAGGPVPSATVTGSEMTGTNGAAVSNGAALRLIGSIVRGTGTGTTVSSGAGLSLTNATVDIAGNSRIEGTLRGISINGTAAGNNIVNIDASQVSASTGPALDVVGTANANIAVTNGSTLLGGNGVAVQVAARATAQLDIAGSAIEGDLVAQTQGPLSGTLNVALSDGASLRGAILNGSSVQLDGASWLLTADSSVQQLEVGSGSALRLGDGDTFHTLQVAGDYTGNGGIVVFNTVLAGDDAQSDRLVIGGDSSGQSYVQVNNIGGAGALTTRGIQLIEIAGASNGTFDLDGRAVAGQYDYFLFKDDGGWYLRSELPVQPDPCDIDPSLPECQGPEPEPEPEPVLRPEPGAYLANLQAASHMFRLGYHERQDGQNGGRVWARVDGTRSAFAADARQLDVRGNSQALSVGTLLLGTPEGSGIGVMLASGNASTTSTSEITGYYARGKVKGNAVGVYGTWRAPSPADPYAGLYLDASLQRALFRNQVHGMDLPSERYDSRAWQGAVEIGYAIPFARSAGSLLFVEPQVQVGYSGFGTVQHTERNGTVVRNEDASGTFGRAGVRVSGVTRLAGAAAEVQPYLAAYWLRSGADPYLRMDGEAVDAHVPRERAEFSAGASVRFTGGFGAWAGLALQQGSGYRLRTAQLGLSYRW
jgi:autotransporter family porin